MDSKTKVFRAHRALAWVYAALFVVLLAVFLFFSDDLHWSTKFPALVVVGIVFSTHYFTARACREGKSGGRVASIVISLFMLLGFPIGTFIGIYLLANTWRPWAVKTTSS